jgi:hypothetical protein
LALLAVVTAGLLWRWLSQPERGPRRAALRQLKIIRASDADGAAVARATQNLIRRYALAVFGHERVARLTGERWLQFVIDAGGDALAGAPGRSLLAAAFGNHAQDDREQWFDGAEAFIRRARRGATPAPVASPPSEAARVASVAAGRADVATAQTSRTARDPSNAAGRADVATARTEGAARSPSRADAPGSGRSSLDAPSGAAK